MARVAIVGSCITRDLWPVRGEAVEGLLYISRTSLPSLLSDPVAGFRPAPTPPAPLRPNPHKALVADLQKTALARLLAFRPTHLIFDFIDERFDLLSVAGALATRSWELEASGYLEQEAFSGARRITRLSGACEQLWLAAAEEFAALVRATPLANARLILHSARWATTSRAPDRAARPIHGMEILPGEPAEVAAHNALLARYEAAFLKLMPPMAIAAAPGHRLADEAHQWGLSPFHYVGEYYAEIRRKLADQGIRIAAPVAPSIPAA